MKEPRVNISIKITIHESSPKLASKIGNTIACALVPETKFHTSDEVVRISSKGTVVFIDISTSAIQPMRAIVNTYARLLSLSYLSLNL